MTRVTLDTVRALDSKDPLAGFRDRFLLPDGLIYLDGNSLGALPKAVPERVSAMLHEEWGNHLIGGWLKDGWMEKPLVLGDRLARLVGVACVHRSCVSHLWSRCLYRHDAALPVLPYGHPPNKPSAATCYNCSAPGGRWGSVVFGWRALRPPTRVSCLF